MQPDVSKERRNGWLALGAALVLSAACVGWYSMDSELSVQLEAAKAQYQKLHGKEPMEVHIKRQREANANLQQTIEDLKKATGFPDATYFTITTSDLASREHAASIFIDKLYQVQDECDKQAQNFSLKKWPESRNLGFTSKVPSDAEVPYMLTMLQLTRRAARICFSTPPLSTNTDPIKQIEFSHEPKPEKPTGPEGRPPLLIEYPLTIKFTASLTETMWILWRFSVGQVDETSQPADPADRIEDDTDAGAYPFMLESFSVVSPAAEESDASDLANAFITVNMRVAAVKFIAQQSRDGGHPAPGPSPGPSLPPPPGPTPAVQAHGGWQGARP